MPSDGVSGDFREANGVLRSPSLNESTFLAALMPKKEIGADRFIEAHPEYDGRGVVIAIFDSGVDPASAGLQITSDGKPKILDILDCTGSGDIDTSKVVKADTDGCIIGASGAKLVLNQSWRNPSGEWHVGSKLVYELFTDSLTSRIKNERKKKWDEKNQEAISNALKQLNEFDQVAIVNPLVACYNDHKKRFISTFQKHTKTEDVKLKRIREDLQHKVDLLRKLFDSYDDKGPVIDAVVWNDGDVWRVALDTQNLDDDPEAVKLSNFIPMTNFRTERRHGIFGKLDACSFVTNIYDDGNILSIVTDSSPHGTHVAGIAAAFHPQEPLLNGVAPGAQLISCKIGDSRLGSMETGTGLTRALIAAVEHKCDLINMSYGEPTLLPDYGRFIDLVNEVVDKYRVIFISSAGNSGPALSTVGAPGGTTSSIFGIGAYVSPAMAAASHCVVDPPSEGLEYTWSSRGPTSDGDLGVCISAPGGAVAPVPTWTLQRRMLMNGTSMASPSACGGVALLISAMKAEGIVVSPYVVRSALENTAIPIGSAPEDKLSTGHGLLQVDRAFEYLQLSKGLPCVSYKTTITQSGKSSPTARGIYLREASACHQATEWTVNIEPKFHEGACHMDELVPFEECLKIHSTDPSVVQAPEYLLLTNNGRTFNIIVDPTNLESGLHYYEVCGTDCRYPWRGSIFRVPITLVKPLTVHDRPPTVSFTGMTFSPGLVERKFINVPISATWVEATMRTSGFDTARRFFVDVVQICPLKRPLKWENVVSFCSSSVKRFNFPVKGGQTLELAIAQFWSSGIGSDEVTLVDFEMEFHGIKVNEEAVVLDGSDAPLRVEAKALLSLEKLAPSAILKKIRIPYRPSEYSLFSLSATRDLLPSGKQILALNLTYKFKMEDTAEITPSVPLLNNRIYDNKIESQFYMISDPNKRIYGSGDVYPKSLKLPKGDYTLKLHIRHDNIQYLEKMKDLILFIERNLGEKEFMQLSCFSQPDGGILGNSSFTSLVLVPGETEAFYVGPPAKEKLPKCCSTGSILVGEITYGNLSFDKGTASQKCPVCYPIFYMVPPLKIDEKDADTDKVDSKKSISDLIDEQVRNAKLKVLSSLKQGNKEEVSKWKELSDSLKMEYPKFTPLLVKILENLLCREDTHDKTSYYSEIINACNDVIESIDRDELAKYFLEKSDPEDEEGMSLKKKMETSRDQLAEALYRKGLALVDNEILVKTGRKSPTIEDLDQTLDGSSHGDLFEENFKELRRWVDVKAPKYALLTVFREKHGGRLGTSLKVLDDIIQDGSELSKKLYDLKIDLLDELGWAHVAAYQRRWMFVRFPPALPLF